MITGIFETGAGLGNQLHEYIMTRVLALDKSFEFSMIFPEYFKGSHFMKLDMGVPTKGLLYEYREKKVLNKDGNDIRDYDWDGVLKVKDMTLVNGYFQGEQYFEHHLDKIREWLKVEPLEMSENTCVIGFRGGEYVGVADLFLPQAYWKKAIEIMKLKYIHIKFEVHTDDPRTARRFFPNFPIVYNVELNWRSVRYAKHLIIANSSFYILPALLGNAKEIIAPKGWAGYNKGYWQLEQNFYKKFTYIHHENI